MEILPPEREPRIRVSGGRVPGWLGATLALLTMLAAFGVGFLVLFGKAVAAALLLWLAWPLLFSPQFTAWVFGSERAPFWKIFVVFLAINMIARLLLRRESWPRK
ncbi:MAG: hypothetical protein PHF00_13895 [Elusimicrobia bacterium]|nr:hypothetical protein [Elusimicrobiota bacterium]